MGALITARADTSQHITRRPGIWRGGRLPFPAIRRSALKPMHCSARLPPGMVNGGRGGGGGTVWDSIVYDPALGLVYVGVGNGGPWYRDQRSPGGGDNLYLSSILALRASTGDVVWYFQSIPGDNWDYGAAQPMMLTDLLIGGELRRVILQASKNGFFYVIDRVTGAFISGTPFAKQTWALCAGLSHRPPD